MERGRKNALLGAAECRWCCAAVYLVLSGWGATLWGQAGGWTTWETSDAVWCGRQNLWSWSYDADSVPVHRLQSPESGRQILWGCPTDSAWSSGAWAADVLWEQDVSGSNANRSTVLWAPPPSDDPGESAWLLATALEAGWLDNSGGVAAGETGSSDPLRCHGPGMAPWVVHPACHDWSSPFRYSASWHFQDAGTWRVHAQDPLSRIQTWVDTTVDIPPTRPPCLGIDVTHTSSNGQRWNFGWKPHSASTLSIDPTWFLADSSHVERMVWPVDPIVGPLELKLPCTSASTPPPLAQSTACDNVFRWPLPCPVEAGKAVWLQHGEGKSVLWRDGAVGLQEGDLAFTEVMPDPTPATHAPESTYLEILNVSDLAFNPEQLTLEDSGDLHALKWVISPPQGVVPPRERFLIVDAALPWEEAALDSVWVVRAVGWSGLRDEGEQVSLRGANGVLETLTFYQSWWEDVSQDGVALSCQNPLACDHNSTWHPDPEGASPGQPAMFERRENDNVSQHWGVQLGRTPSGTVAIHPQPAWDPKHAPYVVMALDDSVVTHSLQAEWTDDGDVSWELPWPQPLARKAHLIFAGIHLCAHSDQPYQIDTMWVGHRPPKPGDVQLTEILPATHPVTEAEFVEWTNLSQDTLAWRGELWTPGKSLVVSSRSREDYRPWLGAAWWADSLTCLWEVEESLALTNARGTVQLRDDWGNVVADSHYSHCGHSDDLGERHGRSMECLPRRITLGADGDFQPGLAWRSEPGTKGMTPGIATDWTDTLAHGPLRPALGHWDGRWITTVPPGSPWRLWRSDLWEPHTDWTARWHEGVLLAVASWGPDSLPRGPRHLEDPTLSFPDVFLGHASASGGPQWNEVLLRPREGHGSFVELILPQAGSWTSEWTWTSDPWAMAEECTPLSDVGWWIPPDTESCLTACPSWVEHGVHRCLPAEVPSFHGDPVLTLWTPQHEVQLDLKSLPEPAWAARPEGLSSALIPGSSHWGTTPPHVEATPGRPNGPSLRESNPSTSALTCHPTTITPGGQQGWDSVELRWKHDADGDTFELEYGVLQPSVTRPLQQLNTTWSAEGLSWTWRGTDLQGVVQPPGTYMGVVTWRNVTQGTRGTDRCLIALAPP